MTRILVESIISGAAAGAIYGLIGLGFSLAYRTTRVINFAQGDLVTLGGYFTLWFVGRHLPLALAAAASMVSVAFITALMERSVLRPLYRASLAYPILATVGLSIIIENLIRVFAGPLPLYVPGFFSGVTEAGGIRIFNSNIGILVVSMAVGLGMVAFIERTNIGRGMRVVAHDHEVAALLGIPANRLLPAAFAMSGGAAALAGVLIAPQLTLSPSMGLSLGINGFTAAVLGGLGSMPGAILGGLFIGVAENVAVLYAPPGLKDGVAYAVLILVLLIRVQGLFGEAAGRGRLV